MKAAAIGIVAQVLAASSFIGGIKLFNMLHPGQEAWSVFLPLLAAAFLIEVIFMRWVRATSKKSLLSLISLSGYVILSWISGVAIFLFLGSSGRNTLGRPTPMVAFAMSMLILILIIKLAGDNDPTP